MNYWGEIKQEINSYFPDNNNKEITASRLRTVMNDVVDNINAWYYGTEEINDQYYTKSYIDTYFCTKNNMNDEISSIYEELDGAQNSVLEIQLSYVTKSYVSSYYQDKLVSGTNIKTLSNMSILGSGNINLPDVNIVEDGTDINAAKVQKDAKEIIFAPNTDTFETVNLTLTNGTLESNFVLATTDYKNVNIVVGVERKIGTWTEDGVTYDLYEKVVNVGNLPNANTLEVLHGITNKVRFVETSGFAYGNNNNNINIPFVNAAGTMFIYMGVGNTKITITTSSDRSGFVGYVTLRFIRAI